MRLHYYTDIEGNSEGGYSISQVKKMIKENGGSGYTAIIERDGTMCDTMQIEVNKRNNNNKKISRHL